jgi:hypothetical protein
MRWRTTISDLPGAPVTAPRQNELTASRMSWPGLALVFHTSSSSQASPTSCETARAFLSGYFSNSIPHLLGDRIDDFAGEVRALLANRSAEGTFWDWPGDTEVVMARKPG